MSKAHDFKFLNFVDDMGIVLVCKPLRYLERVAEFLVELTEAIDISMTTGQSKEWH